MIDILLGLFISVVCVIDGLLYAGKSWEIFHKGARTKEDELWRFFLFPTAHVIGMFRGKNPGASGVLIRFCRPRWLYKLLTIPVWPLRLIYSIIVLIVIALSLPYLLFRA